MKVTVIFSNKTGARIGFDTGEHAVTLLAEHTILWPHELSHLCFAPQKYSHHISIAKSFGHKFSLHPSVLCNKELSVGIMAITRAGAIMAAAKAVSTSRENEKRRKSASRTHKCRKTQSEEQRSEILQTNWTGHAERHTHLSAEERHAERRAHHDMGVIHEEKNSCDNCHHKDFSVDPRYKLMFTVVLNKEIHTCKLAKVKS
jgi:hypothetical protein